MLRFEIPIARFITGSFDIHKEFTESGAVSYHIKELIVCPPNSGVPNMPQKVAIQYRI